MTAAAPSPAPAASAAGMAVPPVAAPPAVAAGATGAASALAPSVSAAPSASAAPSGPGGSPRVRRCCATGETAPPEGMIRFVRAPSGEPVADLAERLPGRGAWVAARRGALQQAVARRAFARAFAAPVPPHFRRGPRLQCGAGPAAALA